jgi:tetratricopeptide (TPR) repeat protein
VLAGGIGAGWVMSRSQPAEAAPVALLAPGGVMSEVEATSRGIRFYEARIKGDPRAAADRAALAGLYLQRSRETGEFADFRRAEELARQSLAIRVKSNSRAARVLTASLLAQHRFADALEAARELVRVWPEDAAHRALLAEIQMEVGDYQAARVTLGTLQSARGELAVAPRMARWAEATGKPAEERELLYEAARRAEFRADLPREQVAWFHLRVGEHELRTGRLDEAERAFRAGLAAEPNDFRLVSSMARLEAHRGRWKQAIEYGEMVGDAADLRTLATIGDAHAALGDNQAAERYYRRVEEAAAENPEPYNRQWTQFRVDRNRNIPETVKLLQEEIRGRKDLLGYDLLAWGLYRAGDYRGARAAAEQALRTGSQDPSFLYHAGLIEAALGNAAGARRQLERALDINPHHPLLAQQARSALKSLDE